MNVIASALDTWLTLDQHFAILAAGFKKQACRQHRLVAANPEKAAVELLPPFHKAPDGPEQSAWQIADSCRFSKRNHCNENHSYL